MSRSLPSLSQDRRGVAALEFALIAPVLLMILGGIVDFGLIMVGRSRLANAVMQGAQLALFTGPGATASAIRTNVQSGAARAGLTETVIVTVTGPACYCPSGTPPALGPATALSANSSCSGTCPGSANGPGAFVTIAASYTYQPLMPLLSRLMTPTMTQSTVVRLL